MTQADEMGEKTAPAHATLATQDSNEKTRRSMRYSILDGTFYSLMTGFADAYITPFALSLRATNFQIGLLNSAPALANSLGQPIGARLSEKLRNRRAVLLPFALLHRFMWVPILLVPLLFGARVELVIFLFLLYQLFLALSIPAWASTMGDIVPPEERGRYFGARNKLTGAAAFLATLIGGAVLFLYGGGAGFVLLFAVATISGLVSFTYLARVHDPPYRLAHAKSGMADFLFSLYDKKLLFFAAYICAVSFAVTFSSAYFTVYMLRDLRMDYAAYALVSAIMTLTMFLSQPYWGKISDRFGTRATLVASGLLIPAVPFLWLLSQNFYHILFIQVLAGFSWAGYNLSVFNYILDSAPSANKTRHIANFNSLNNAFAFLGATSGAFVATFVADKSFIGLYGLQLIFLITGIIRILALPLLARVREVRVPGVSARHLFWNIVVIYPTNGIANQLLNGWHEITKVENGGVRRSLAATGEVTKRVAKTMAKTVEKPVRTAARVGMRVEKTVVRTVAKPVGKIVKTVGAVEKTVVGTVAKPVRTVARMGMAVEKTVEKTVAKKLLRKKQ
ncbi:MAG: MFS transporter [Candidatus Micrarchaeota archaeon]